ncbi:MAG: phenylalanine--tRNA ligase subunit alpha [Thermaerobacter sp.]|nr:phenylalanine--tRNA ligase subunit alpha [Thermaerobacter sp.]
MQSKTSTDGRWWDWFEETLRTARDLPAIQSLRYQWLGKRGQLTVAMKELAQLPAEQRRLRGQQLNQLRQRMVEALDIRQREIDIETEAALLNGERLDMTMPGRPPRVGLLHPLTRARRRIEDVLLRMGFSLHYGPQVESEWYNFEALNIPAGHPARDMQDSFFVDVPNMVLRTHTSPVQIRAMQQHQGRLPVKVLAPGVVYRRDDDATHTPMFQQVEGLVIDHGIGLADLKGTLTTMVREVLGERVETRFRSSYFPFTEPSVEMDVTCAACGGVGCRTCKATGWVEILGSGMVHPVVLANGGYDASVVSGFAFGLGIERLAMRLFGLDDLRLLYQNDLQFLQQFIRWEGGRQA